MLYIICYTFFIYIIFFILQKAAATVAGSSRTFPLLPRADKYSPPPTSRHPLVPWVKIPLTYLLVAFIFNCF